MSTSEASARRTPLLGRIWILWAALLLALLIAGMHGRSLRYGLFMDDYAHYQQLRECGWSPRGLTDACHLDLVGGVIELWWMPQVTLRFFRPAAFGLMKLTYTLSGWNPMAMHVASLTWHLATCVLLTLLLRRLGAGRRLAWAVAALFAIHPGHVATVQWIASQTELIVTTLTLGALLCWARFRGWACSPPVENRSHSGGSAGPESSGAGPRRYVWGVASLVLFAFALGCRENAIMLPLVLAATELVMWRRSAGRPVLVVYAAFAVIAVIYLGVRSHYLGGAALPPRPYVVPPTNPGFLGYVFDKACYYLLGEFLLVPCVPIGGLAYFRARPLVFYGLAFLVAATLLLLVVRNRRSVAGVLGPACLFGFMAPVLPAFESPHHLYLPGVGWAIMAMLFLRWIGGARQTSSPSSMENHSAEPTLAAQAGSLRHKSGSRRDALMWSGVLATGLVFAAGTYFSGLALDTAQAVEDRVVDEIATAPRPVEDGDTLYLANPPMIAHYAKLAVEQRTGRRNLRVRALNWSPRLLGMASPSELTWIDERTIDIRVADDRFFAGPLQRLIRESTGADFPDSMNTPLECDGFTILALDFDARGVSRIRVRFSKPPTGDGIHLFWGSQTRWAWQVAR